MSLVSSTVFRYAFPCGPQTNHTQLSGRADQSAGAAESRGGAVVGWQIWGPNAFDRSWQILSVLGGAPLNRPKLLWPLSGGKFKNLEQSFDGYWRQLRGFAKFDFPHLPTAYGRRLPGRRKDGKRCRSIFQTWHTHNLFCLGICVFFVIFHAELFHIQNLKQAIF